MQMRIGNCEKSYYREYYWQKSVSECKDFLIANILAARRDSKENGEGGRGPAEKRHFLQGVTLSVPECMVCSLRDLLVKVCYLFMGKTYEHHYDNETTIKCATGKKLKFGALTFSVLRFPSPLSVI